MLLPGISPSGPSNPTENHKLGRNDAKAASWGSLGIAKRFQDCFSNYVANHYYTGDKQVTVQTKEGSFLILLKFFLFFSLSNGNSALLDEETRSRAARCPHLSHRLRSPGHDTDTEELSIGTDAGGRCDSGQGLLFDLQARPQPSGSKAASHPLISTWPELRGWASPRKTPQREARCHLPSPALTTDRRGS